jgi:2-polyprenyl-6-methoxyphenol hydroxylase-like FAD-dependent oxidoreductase
MPSPTDRPILIAGGGPVGFITALALARQGLPVHVFEAEARVNDMPRAATTHAATLEMLEDLGLVDEVIRPAWSNRCSACGIALRANWWPNSTSACSRTTRAIRSQSSASSTSSPT